jgi:hypothetical protein
MDSTLMPLDIVSGPVGKCAQEAQRRHVQVEKGKHDDLRAPLVIALLGTLRDGSSGWRRESFGCSV